MKVVSELVVKQVQDRDGVIRIRLSGARTGAGQRRSELVVKQVASGYLILSNKRRSLIGLRVGAPATRKGFTFCMRGLPGEKCDYVYLYVSLTSLCLW